MIKMIKDFREDMWAVLSRKNECKRCGGETLRGGDVDEDVSLVDGVLDGALGALGDEIGSLGDGVFVSSCVNPQTRFCGIVLIFGLLETLEIEALVEAIKGIPNCVQAFWANKAETRKELRRFASSFLMFCGLCCMSMIALDFEDSRDHGFVLRSLELQSLA
ncbi:hypothetical protein Tco_0454153 [Tanacetum coccineum]